MERLVDWKLEHVNPWRQCYQQVKLLLKIIKKWWYLVHLWLLGSYRKKSKAWTRGSKKSRFRQVIIIHVI